ncbi:MAG: hypothetical protein KKG47_11900 [Proteobacteria bacterium]|nr:hypothetical protein [Pseudomonadota bacterium]MBU1737824.1 hypothetical protein [Pseudomonadota bacterium]
MNTNTGNQKAASEGINTNSAPELQEGVMQVAMGLLIATAAAIGIWGLVSLFSGITMTGGILDMITGWMSAVTGR